MFRGVRSRLDKAKTATKLSIKSHTTNIDEIRSGKTTEFKMIITLKGSSERIEHSIGILNTLETVKDRMRKSNIPEITNINDYGLE